MNKSNISGSYVRSSEKKKNRSGIFKVMASFAAFSLIIYSVVTIISQQVQIAKLRQEEKEINERMSEARQLNDEYSRLLSSEDEDAYMEMIAVERLGYAYPEERRFYIVEAK